jgi:hypothetical protein
VQGVTNASLLVLQRDESVTTGSLACTLEALELIPGPDILTLSVNVQPSANACAFPVGSQVRAFSRVQGVTNASLLALQRDESVTTGSLACTLEALEQIHRQMFEAMQNGDGRSRGMWDAATFAKRHRASVLDGVVLLFSKCLQPLKVCVTSFLLFICLIPYTIYYRSKGKTLAMSRPTDPLFHRPLPGKLSLLIVKKLKILLKSYLVLSRPCAFSPKGCHYYGRHQKTSFSSV